VIQAAHTGGCVIVGHGAQASLRGRGPASATCFCTAALMGGQRVSPHARE
jgi:hypothetical protein